VSGRRRLLLAALAAVAVWLLVAMALFVLQSGDDPGRADAVVVLAGSPHRLPVGERLVDRGAAPVLALSRDPDGRGNPPVQRRCRQGETPGGDPVVCFVADPYSTRGEAQALARLAGEEGWGTVIVVTSRFHIFRSRLLLERCFGGEVRMSSAPVDWWRWPQALTGETAKLGRALLTARDC
jgi:uncharacterized SAM-binding protein YcdF (DUF218 family)